MKRKPLLFLLLLALMMPWTAQAQETLTVYGDGANSNSKVPFYGSQADKQGTASECIIPNDQLEAMTGGRITAMTFYLASPASAAWTGTHQVYLGEVDTTTMTGIIGPEQFTVVRTAQFNATGSTLTVTFDTPYTYTGGNLLIGTYVSVAGNYKSASFTGVNQTENTGWSRYGTSTAGSAAKFLPKTTFTYEPASTDCERPEALVAHPVTTEEATLSWSGGSGIYNVEYKKESDSVWTSLLDSTTLYSTILPVEGNTAYSVRVQSVCADENSNYTTVSFRTPCEAITTFPWSEDFEDYAYGTFTDPCWVNEHISGTGTSLFSIFTDYIGTNYTHQLRLPSMSSGTLTKLRLPEMNLPSSNYQFSIDVYRSNSTYNSNYMYEGIRVFASTDGEIAGATELAFIPRQYNVGNEIIPSVDSVGWYTYDLPIGFGGTCYIILRGESQYCTATYMDNLSVTERPIPVFTKTIAGYGEGNDKWYLIANPLDDVVDPETTGMIAEVTTNYDLYAFDPSQDENEWQNYKHGDGFSLVNGRGYLYACKTDTILSFVGMPYSGNGQVPLYYNADGYKPGWNLIGNPFADTAYIDRDFYKMNSEGTSLIHVPSGTDIAPMEGIFVVAEGPNDTVVTFHIRPNDGNP